LTTASLIDRDILLGVLEEYWLDAIWSSCLPIVYFRIALIISWCAEVSGEVLVSETASAVSSGARQKS